MTNPFEILGLPRSMNLSDEELEDNYLQLSREHHPDFHSSASSDDQVAVLHRSAEINDAYRALRDPWHRAEALVQLTDPQALADTKILCPMFLMEAMEVREAALEAPAEELSEIEASVSAKVDEYFADVAHRIETGAIREAATLIHQSNYYRKALAALRDRIHPEP